MILEHKCPMRHSESLKMGILEPKEIIIDDLLLTKVLQYYLNCSKPNNCSKTNIFLF